MANILSIIEKEYLHQTEKETVRLASLHEYARKDNDFKQNEILLKENIIALAKAQAYDENPCEINRLREENKSLKLKREKILSKLKLTEKHFERQFLCKLCKDTGYVNGKPCKCFELKWKKYYFQELGIAPVPNYTFKKDTAAKPEKLNKTYALMKKYVEKFPNASTRNFLFTGKPGCGKTFLATIVAGELAKKGYNVIFVTATELVQMLLKFHLSSYSDMQSFLSLVYKCDLLVIDDLGTENFYKNVTCEYLLAIISERLAKEKHTITTTNLSMEEIMNRYGERFASRLYEKKSSAAIEFEDINFRLQK